MEIQENHSKNYFLKRYLVSQLSIPGTPLCKELKYLIFFNDLPCCSQKQQTPPHNFCANFLMLCSGYWPPSSNGRLGKGTRWFGMKRKRLGGVFLEGGVLTAPSTSVLLGVHFLLWLTQPLRSPRWNVHCLAGSWDICSSMASQWGFGAVELVYVRGTSKSWGCQVLEAALCLCCETTSRCMRLWVERFPQSVQN